MPGRERPRLPKKSGIKFYPKEKGASEETLKKVTEEIKLTEPVDLRTLRKA